ncbi:DUF3515 domain-containing protein [Dietzia sp. ANT_WB102]|uniref:DUF3515 domain-containing protein n=1 Tax=Dietzia sp. ANT_WB102 TaxID=2597345 RepID=UPI0011ED826D|nr:DUF3515 domain-containing protein [Dietzia sp. ANT_WB102]KAA0919508.1 DUF3515 domain-containing protein [Dietzia sp. ANT_WB102]
MATTDSDPGNRYDAGPRDTADSTERAVPVSTIVVVLAVVIPLVLLAVVLVMVRSVGDQVTEAAVSEPVAVVPIPSPGAGSEECAALVAALPEALGDAVRVALAEPAPEGTAAYRMPNAEPVIVRCGLPAPPSFTVGVALQEVNRVQWFNEPDPDPAVTASTWVAVDRPQFVAVTLPEDSGTGPIQDLSDALSETLEAVEPAPAPIR